jgi:hypothetical protein
MRSSWDRGYFLSTVERSVWLTVSTVKGKIARRRWRLLPVEIGAAGIEVRRAQRQPTGMLRRTLFIPGLNVLFLLVALTLTGLFFYAATRR